MNHAQSERFDAVLADLEARGFSLREGSYATVSEDGPASLTGVDGPLSVIELADARPLSVVSAIANATQNERVPVLVTDSYDHDDVLEIVSAPFLLAEQRDGRRFLSVEDRIMLTDGTFACVGSRGPIQWTEETDRGSTESPAVDLVVGGERVAVLESVDELRCPGPTPATFRYRYTREDDGRFAVYEGAERRGRYAGVTAMRASGFRPLPAPLVPEHHIRQSARLARAGLLATVAHGTVEYTPFGE